MIEFVQFRKTGEFGDPYKPVQNMGANFSTPLRAADEPGDCGLFHRDPESLLRLREFI